MNIDMLNYLDSKSLALILWLSGMLTSCATTGAPGGFGGYVSDSATTAKVKLALISNQDVSARAISVTTNNGVVKLSGTAASQQEADTAAAIAQGIPNVKAVQNEVAVK